MHRSGGLWAAACPSPGSTSPNVVQAMFPPPEWIDSRSGRIITLGIRIEIRQANSSDAPFITDCNLRLALETERRRLDPARVRKGVEALLNDPARGTYLVAEWEGALAGQLLITYEWSDWRNGNFWWLQSVYVAETFRGRGVFRALFEHVRALARARRDVCGLRLYMDAQNSRARQAYHRLGMTQTEYEVFEMDFAREG